MAHLCVYDPPAVGMGNKDKESEEPQKEMPQADDIDLEEGEIIDSCGEDNFGESEKVNDSIPCEELDISDKKKKKKRKKKKKDNDDDQNDPEKPPKKKRVKYIDHDRVDEEDDWYITNSLLYSKKNFGKVSNDGNVPLQLSGYDVDYYSPDLKSSPSQDEDELNEETDQQNRKIAWKNPVKRQNNERIMKMKKKRKDGLLRGTHDAKKRRMMMQNKNKRKVVKAKQRAPLCKFFLEGRCSKGSDCPFSHATQPSAKKELCKFYVNGYCAKGENCLYMHEEFPCKFFHTGAKCYSEPNCLFSHAPLTEETKRILDKYLESSKVEEEKEKDENAKDTSPQKQQQKRPSLLGSPPRHVKEAAETLKWRQYVSQMQQHPRRFDRYNNPRNPLMLNPPHLLARPPNFYIDTLPRSPAKIPSLMSMPPIAMPPLNPNLPLAPLLKMPGIYSDTLEGEVSSQEEWENNVEFHKRNNIKNDQNTSTANNTTDTSAKQTTIAEPVSNSTETVEQHVTMDVDMITSNAESIQTKEKEVKVESISSADTEVPPEQQMTNNQQTANSPPTDSMLPLPPPLVIPTHLPRRQRELYLRIQQHQKEADSGTDVSEDPESKAEEEKSENWYSSDEDDTEDQPLTAVLKKLQLTPLPNTSQQSSLPTTSSNSTIDIAKMLTEIRQQATQKSVPNGSNTTNQQKDFWQSLLSGAAPTAKDPRSNAAVEHLQAQNKPESRDPRIRNSATSADSANTSPPSRDPRLHRDPRLAVRDPRSTPANGPNTNPVAEGITVQLPLPPPLWEGHSTVIKTNNVVTEKVKSVGNVPVPYKLRSITVSQPNYSSYVFACQSNPKLLNDPRLKKYFKQMSGLLRQQQNLTEDVKPVTPVRDSKNQFEGQAKAFVGKDDQGDSSTSSDAWDRVQKQRAADPRIVKIPLNVPRPTGSTTPPLPVPTSAPTINPTTTNTITTTTTATTTTTSSANTSVTSHLPKSVTDPRLTRLLHQPEHRRPVSCDQNPLVNKPLPIQRKLSAGNIRLTSSSVTPQVKQSSVKDSQSCASGSESPKAEETSTVCPTAEKEKKKKLTSYNRKSSMDYASPLSSYEDSSNSNSYSSYNRRPQPSQPAVTSAGAQPSIPQPPKSVSPVDVRSTVQESSSHNQALSFLSNETSAEAVVVSEHTPSLKEVFKTIDPTASPFCSI